MLNNLIKMYFNLNSMVNKGEKFSRRRNKHRYNSANKIFVGNTEIKHFNDKIVITIYIFNRIKKYFFKLLEKLYKNIFRNNFIDIYGIINSYKINTKLCNKNNFYINKIIKKKYKHFLNRKHKLKFKLKKNKKNNLNFNKLRKFYLIKTYKNLYLNNLISLNINKYNTKFKQNNLNKTYLDLKLLHAYNKGNITLKNFLYRYNSIVKLLKEKKIVGLDKLVNKNKLFILKKDFLKINREFIKTKLWKEMLYLKFNQMLKINLYKYTNVYLNGLKKTIENIYRKNVEFNIIDLKYLHLDSQIFSKFIGLKMKNRKNKAIRILKKALFLPKISLSKDFLFNIHKLYIVKQNYLNMYLVNKRSNILNNNIFSGDKLHVFFYNIFNLKKLYSYADYYNTFDRKQKFIYRSVKFKKIIGVRFEAKGRLTNRLTASRAIYKLRYKGNLKNIDTVNNLSSVIMKGYLKSNIDYTNINSKTRNGCFGLKGWINSK